MHHLVVIIVGIPDLPGLQVAVKLLFLCEGTVPGLIILIGIGGLIKLPLALRALYKLPVVIIEEVPLRSLPLRVLVLPRVLSGMDARVIFPALMAVIYAENP